MSIIGHGANPEPNGNVYFETYEVIDSTANIEPLVAVFIDTGTTDSLLGSFIVPQNYVGSPIIVVHWTANATSGDVRWRFEYLATTAGEDLGDAGDEVDSVTDTKTGTAFVLESVDITGITAGNLVAGDLVSFTISRDGAHVDDDMAADAVMFDCLFEYSDT
jgi:hypothetical protein